MTLTDESAVETKEESEEIKKSESGEINPESGEIKPESEKSTAEASANAVSEKISKAWTAVFTKISSLGEYLFTAFLAIARVVAESVLWIISRILLGAEWLGKHLKRLFRKVADVVGEPISRYTKALSMGKTEISRARDKGSIRALAAGAKVTGRVVFGKRGIAVTIANWVLPIVSCIFLFNIVGYANSQSYALKLTVNGSFMGYIPDENVYLEAAQIVQKRINYTGSHTKAITLEPGIEVDITGYANTLNNNQLADKLLELLMGADNIMEGYGLYVGDAFYGTLVSPDKTSAALDKLLDKYRTDTNGESVDFDKEITFTQGLYLTESFVDEDTIIKTLTSYKQVSKFYTVVTGDAYITIANKVGMSFEELDLLNPGFLNMSLHGGDQIKITEEEPFLSVKITRPETYKESVAYETEYYEDPTLYEGNKAVKTKGVLGERTVKANVSYVNGVEVSRTITSRTLTKQPVTEVMAVGTKPRPATDTAPGTTIEANKVLWPVGGNGGLISEVTAAHGGYGGHKGIDIVAPQWTPIYASHNGYVIEVGSQPNKVYGRGYYVRIQGDDGFVTHYYHMAEWPSCYTGQRVTAGDVIGYVGDTGAASAYHLHFEIRYGGIPQYPVDYLAESSSRFASWCYHY